MKRKFFTVAAIICLFFTFSSDVQAMAVIGGAEIQEFGRIIHHRRIIRRVVVPRVVVAPVVIVSGNRNYRRGCPPSSAPPIRRHWRYYR